MRRAYLAAGWAWVAAIVWLSLTPSPPPPIDLSHGDKAGHFFAYAGLMFWFAQLYAQRVFFAVGFIAMGIALEFAQGASGYRSFDVIDMAANALGVLAGWAAALILPRLRLS
jgi:VanZ family protein